jgi:hypothetical protein
LSIDNCCRNEVPSMSNKSRASEERGGAKKTFNRRYTI